MANKKMKWFSIATLACAASLCIGFGAANVTADAEEVAPILEGFAISTTSIRLGTGSLEDPTGLRFRVDVPTGKTVTNAYTTVAFTTDGKDYSTDVPATVWRADESGWNTVLLEIPVDAFTMDVTATAYATIDGTKYQTTTQISSIAKTAAQTIKHNALPEDQVAAFNAFVGQAVTDITLDKAEATVSEGETLQLNVTTAPVANFNVSWKSTDETVATVDENGLVTAKSAGEASITASMGNITAISYVTVESAVQYETFTEKVTFKNVPTIAQNGVAFTSYELGDILITGDKGSNSNPPKYYTSGEAIRVYGGNEITFTAADNGIISTIKLVKGTDSGNGATVTAGTYTDSTGVISNINANTVTFTYGGSSGNVQIKGVEITYQLPPLTDDQKAQKAADSLAESVAALKTNIATAEGSFDLPTVDGAEKVEWFLKSASTYAEITADGQLKVTSIPATKDEALTLYAVVTAKVNNATATANTKEFTFTIVAPVVSEKTVTATIASIATKNGWANESKHTSFALDSSITVSSSGSSNTGKYYTSGNDWRLYQTESAKMTITANGKTIVSVKVTYSVSKGGVLINDTTNVTSGTKVTVNASSITFSVGNTGTATNGQVRVTEIEVVYK